MDFSKVFTDEDVKPFEAVTFFNTDDLCKDPWVVCSRDVILDVPVLPLVGTDGKTFVGIVETNEFGSGDGVYQAVVSLEHSSPERLEIESGYVFVQYEWDVVGEVKDGKFVVSKLTATHARLTTFGGCGGALEEFK